MTSLRCVYSGNTSSDRLTLGIAGTPLTHSIMFALWASLPQLHPSLTMEDAAGGRSYLFCFRHVGRASSPLGIGSHGEVPAMTEKTSPSRSKNKDFPAHTRRTFSTLDPSRSRCPDLIFRGLLRFLHSKQSSTLSN